MNTKAKLKKYSFKGKLWKYKGPAGWYFVTLPRKLSTSIRKNHGLSEEGWGRLKAIASIGDCKWQTAIWFDSKAVSYLLPIKASVRKAAEIDTGSSTLVTLQLQSEDLRFSLLAKADARFAKKSRTLLFPERPRTSLRYLSTYRLTNTRVVASPQGEGQEAPSIPAAPT